nr:hypothetical protein [Candidatus Sigynarchaeota archaeon]
MVVSYYCKDCKRIHQRMQSGVEFAKVMRSRVLPACTTIAAGWIAAMMIASTLLLTNQDLLAIVSIPSTSNEWVTLYITCLVFLVLVAIIVTISINKGLKFNRFPLHCILNFLGFIIVLPFFLKLWPNV